MFFSLDSKDLFYIISGFAFLVIKILPSAKYVTFLSAPMVFILLGILLTFTGLNVPFQNVIYSDIERKVLEHFTEFIVIISLAGVGLAVDRKAGIKTWKHTWLLLAVVMPLTMLGFALIGAHVLNLPLASALLLAAVLAPTDPVLARSVQVEGPNKGEENDVNVSLTSEAGLNDGLAFPFVYLALAVGLASANNQLSLTTFVDWALYDLIYRVLIAVLLGILGGFLLCNLMPKVFDEGKKFNQDAGLILMSSTFLSYGLTELFSGYGFLAVFVTALSSKYFYNKEVGDKNHAKLPHMFSEQFEKMAMVLILVWLGYFTYQNVFPNLKLQEILVSLAIILIVRPVVAYLVLMLTGGSKLDRFAISFLGIRGIGSLYYLAYAHSKLEFNGIESIWRVTVMCVILSIFLHGTIANRLMIKIHRKAEKIDNLQ